MAVKFTNNAATTLAAGINSSATSISVTDGSVFPSLSSGEHFYCTFDDTTNVEIVKVTARSSNTLTVVRGQDDTTARAFSSGDKAELRVVAALLEDVKTEVTSTLSVNTYTGDGSTTAFTLSQSPASEDNLIVFIEGVYQNPNDFVLNGTTLTFDVAPANTRKIVAYHVSAAVSGNNLNHDQFTYSAGNAPQFTLSIAPIHENNTQVFIDGVYQQKDSYAVSGSTLTLDASPANGATVEVMTFTQTDVNTLPASFVSGLTQVTAVGADHFMIFDATDNALKKSLVSDVLESATSISTSADATAITIDSNEKVTFTSDVTTGGHLSIGGNNNELRFYEGVNYVGFEAPALSADQIWVLPAADGSNGQALVTDGSGNLSFSTVSGGVAGISSSADATAITINSSEQVGIGTTSPNARLVVSDSGDSPVRFISSGQATNYLELANTGGSAMVFSNNNDLVFGTSNSPTERMRITSSGVMIGTTSNDSLFHIESSSSTAMTIQAGTNSSASLRLKNDAVDWDVNCQTNDNFAIYSQTASAERLVINSSGNLGMGGSPDTTHRLTVAAEQSSGKRCLLVHSINAGLACVVKNTSGTGAYDPFAFLIDGGNTQVGGIASGAGGTAFNTSSDYRLKENVDYTWDATTRLKQLKPARFNWILDETDTTVDGFLAHEVEDIVPEAITGTKDATQTHTNVVREAGGFILAVGVSEDDWTEGKTGDNPIYPSDSTWSASLEKDVYQQIDQAKLVPLLVKTIQELEARITTLENA